MKFYRVAAILLVLALAPPAQAQEPPSIALTIRDHQFVPAEIVVPTGVKAQLIVRNEQATPAEFESTSLHREKIVTPGASISVYVGPLDPGRYEFFDDFYPSTRGFVVVK
ncbi:MAG TPA: cupredoxin domain-containing protein [Stellaceae bacterium]|nr:cupredoxin domain-containing protein [Stellaceae bacterium]